MVRLRHAGVCMRICELQRSASTSIYLTTPTLRIDECAVRRSAAGGQADGTCRDQRARCDIEGQVDGEHDVAPVPVEVHREVDSVRRRLLCLHPAELRGTKPDRLSVVQHKLVGCPGGALQHETWAAMSTVRKKRGGNAAYRRR